MPSKENSKPVYVDGAVYSAFRKKLEAEGWTWGITKKVESLLSDYAQGRLRRLEGEILKVAEIGQVRPGRAKAKDNHDQAQAG